MTTPIIRVVNVRHLARHERDRVIYVGRTCYGFDGHLLHNPLRVPRDAPEGVKRHVLDKYWRWVNESPIRRQALRELADEVRRTGKSLGCWCCDWVLGEEPEPLCHAVLLAKEVGRILAEDGYAD